jgi:hypothetical protein
MYSLLFTIYRIIVPKPLRTIILKTRLKRKIIDHYSGLHDDEVNAEEREVLDYLRTNEVEIFPYSFSRNYSPDDIEVLYDTVTGMYYVMHEGKKLFFRKGWSKKRIRSYYSNLCREQDPLSPHRYLSDDFAPGKEDTVVDIGSAEGNFSLSVADRVKKLYLIEYDRKWIRALEATFAPWKDKTVIIGKYISDRNSEKEITLDTLAANDSSVSWLKIDVDGFESRVLEGFGKCLSGKRSFKIALCTYHRHDDERIFTSLLQGKGFRVSPSHGYMINYYDKMLVRPWLRRGLIRAVR